MSKFSRDLDESLVKKVKDISSEMGLKNYVNIEAICLNKSKKEIGTVVKGNELVSLFTGDDSIVAVALYEKAFLMVDEQTQEIWIRGLLSQIKYDIDKDKIVIEKPEISIPISVYHQFGDIAVKKAELAIHTLQQIADMEAEMKKGKKKGK